MTRAWVKLVMAAMLILAVTSAALAAGAQVVVTSTVGNVQHRSKQGAAWSRTKVGVRLSTGAQLWTAKNSAAELRFPDGTKFRLGPQSSISITSASPTAASVPKGSVFARIVKGSLVRIKGKYGVAAVRGTQVAYEVTDEGEVLRAWDGTVEYGPEGQTIEVADGMGSWLFPFGGPATPRRIAPQEFSGVQFQPWWHRVRTGVDMSATQGTDIQRAQLGRQAEAREALLAVAPGPGRANTGHIDVELEGVRTAQAGGGASAGGGVGEVVGAAAAAATAASPSQVSLERSVGDWLWGPVGAFGAYGFLGEGESVAGARAKVSAVIKDVYLQAAVRYSAGTDIDNDWFLDETFAAVREDDFEAQAGRLRLLEGPASNSDIGSLLPFATVDGARVGVWFGPRWRGVFSWLGEYDSLLECDVKGEYGRLQYFAKGGWIGLGALHQHDAGTGVTGQFALPLGNDAVEVYGEFGDDPQGHHLATFGLYFPTLFYDHDINLHIEHATRADYDTLSSLHAYWECSKDWWILGTIDHSDEQGTRIGAGVLCSFEGF